MTTRWLAYSFFDGRGLRGSLRGYVFRMEVLRRQVQTFHFISILESWLVSRAWVENIRKSGEFAS